MIENDIFEKRSAKLIDTDQKFKDVVSRLDFRDLVNYLDLLGTYKFFHREVITSLSHLSFKLRDKMVGYDTVLADDVSGRLVGLYLFEQIKIKKATDGLSDRTAFYGVVGGRKLTNDQELAVKGFIGNKKNSLGKTLLVTEYIHVGNGIIDLANYLRENGVDFDIASVSLSPEFLNSNVGIYSNNDWIWLKNKIIYGDDGNSGLAFYKAKENGVVKNEPSNHRFMAHAQKNRSVNQSIINSARKDIRYLARKVLMAME